MPDEYLTNAEMRPASPKVVLIVLEDGSVYKREGEMWRCLDYKPTEDEEYGGRDSQAPNDA